MNEVSIIINDMLFLVNKEQIITKNEIIKKEPISIRDNLPIFKVGMVVKTKDRSVTANGVIAEVHSGYDPCRKEQYKSSYAIITLDEKGFPKSFSAWYNENNIELVCDDLEYGYKLLSYYERNKHNNKRSKV